MGLLIDSEAMVGSLTQDMDVDWATFTYHITYHPSNTPFPGADSLANLLLCLVEIHFSFSQGCHLIMGGHLTFIFQT